MRLPRCVRASRALNADPFLSLPRQPADHFSMHGVKQHDFYTPPAPHARQQITIGSDPHREVYRDPTSRPLTLSEQLDALVAKSRG